jgi:2-iminobutanoate/2-iminopropanoate deaminase
MARREIKHPNRNAYTGGYADGVVLDRWLYVSGQGPLDLSTGKVVPGTIEEETKLTLENVAAVFGQVGCTKADVAKCTCFLSKIEDFKGFDKAFSSFFQGVRPARTTVQAVLGLGIKVEIDAVALIPSSSKGNEND